MGVKTRNLGNSEGKDIQWQAPLNADGSTIYNLEAGKGYFINTTGGEVELKLPIGSLGDRIAIIDFAGTFDTNMIRLNLNGQKLNGSNNPSENAGMQNYVSIEEANARLELVFTDSDKGWMVTESESKTSPTGAPFGTFTAATGGTVTTSGNFKIHTFTGDGNFVVSQLGNPAGSTNKVSYVVVAGGGGGGIGYNGGHCGGGGGAGGYREGKTPVDTFTASPLVAPDGVEITATTFPVTVGGGGTGRTGCNGCNNGPNVKAGDNGSNSVFSTITSTGGGGGAGGDRSPSSNSGNGGSGGGGGSDGNYPGTPAGAAGSGNTPPVSPPQGNDGGNGPGQAENSGGGGGGATQAGQPRQPGPNGGTGGAGATSCITGSPVARAGGGGGSGQNGTISGGAGGGGTGGKGNPPATNATAGSANTGGGGGGGIKYSLAVGGNGGKGVVIIRYKFQAG